MNCFNRSITLKIKLKMKIFFTIGLKMVFIGWCISLISCRVLPNKEIENLNWLIGTWQHIGLENTYETWEKTNDTLLEGAVWKLKGADTIVTETIQIKLTPSAVFYIPIIENQNEGKPVIFTQISGDFEALIFENQQHDFPNLISYNKIGEDKIAAWIGGKGKRIPFNMKRVKKN